MDVTLVRILTVLISLFTGVPVILYIIALFVIPEEGAPGAPPRIRGDAPSLRPTTVRYPRRPAYAPYRQRRVRQPPAAAPRTPSGAPRARRGSSGRQPPTRPRAGATAPPAPSRSPRPEPAPPVVRARSLTRSAQPRSRRPTRGRAEESLSESDHRWSALKITRADARITGGADQVEEVAVDPEVVGDLRMERRGQQVVLPDGDDLRLVGAGRRDRAQHLDAIVRPAPPRGRG